MDDSAHLFTRSLQCPATMLLLSLLLCTLIVPFNAFWQTTPNKLEVPSVKLPGTDEAFTPYAPRVTPLTTDTFILSYLNSTTARPICAFAQVLPYKDLSSTSASPFLLTPAIVSAQSIRDYDILPLPDGFAVAYTAEATTSSGAINTEVSYRCYVLWLRCVCGRRLRSACSTPAPPPCSPPGACPKKFLGQCSPSCTSFPAFLPARAVPTPV